jgi:hypothetical protein
MTEQSGPAEAGDVADEKPRLPRHLSALAGALSGPPDLGRNHDKYLAYPDREETGGAASA